MPILTDIDIDDLSAAWNRRRDDAFRDAITDDFVATMVSHVPENLKAQMLWAIHNATTPAQLQVNFGVQYEISHTFTADGWGDRRLSLKHVLYRTNALERIAQAIGPNIKVSFRYGVTTIFFTIDFWPIRAYPHVVHNPEDQYDDMPPLEGHGQ